MSSDVSSTKRRSKSSHHPHPHHHHHRHRRRLNADLYDDDDNDRRDDWARRPLSPDSLWKELQFQRYLKTRMRRKMQAKTRVVDDKGRPVTLAERIIRQKLMTSSVEGSNDTATDMTDEQQQQAHHQPLTSGSEDEVDANPHPQPHPATREDRKRSLVNLLHEYIQQRQAETACSSQLLEEISLAKQSLSDHVIRPLRDSSHSDAKEAGRCGSSTNISLGDSATDYNAKFVARQRGVTAAVNNINSCNNNNNATTTNSNNNESRSIKDDSKTSHHDILAVDDGSEGKLFSTESREEYNDGGVNGVSKNVTASEAGKGGNIVVLDDTKLLEIISKYEIQESVVSNETEKTRNETVIESSLDNPQNISQIPKDNNVEVIHGDNGIKVKNVQVVHTHDSNDHDSGKACVGENVLDSIQATSGDENTTDAIKRERSGAIYVINDAVERRGQKEDEDNCNDSKINVNGSANISTKDEVINNFDDTIIVSPDAKNKNLAESQSVAKEINHCDNSGVGENGDSNTINSTNNKTHNSSDNSPDYSPDNATVVTKGSIQNTNTITTQNEELVTRATSVNRDDSIEENDTGVKHSNSTKDALENSSDSVGILNVQTHTATHGVAESGRILPTSSIELEDTENAMRNYTAIESSTTTLNHGKESRDSQCNQLKLSHNSTRESNHANNVLVKDSIQNVTKTRPSDTTDVKNGSVNQFENTRDNSHNITNNSGQHDQDETGKNDKNNKSEFSNEETGSDIISEQNSIKNSNSREEDSVENEEKLQKNSDKAAVSYNHHHDKKSEKDSAMEDSDDDNITMTHPKDRHTKSRNSSSMSNSNSRSSNRAYHFTGFSLERAYTLPELVPADMKEIFTGHRDLSNRERGQKLTLISSPKGSNTTITSHILPSWTYKSVLPLPPIRQGGNHDDGAMTENNNNNNKNSYKPKAGLLSGTARAATLSCPNINAYRDTGDPNHSDGYTSAEEDEEIQDSGFLDHDNRHHRRQSPGDSTETHRDSTKMHDAISCMFKADCKRQNAYLSYQDMPDREKRVIGLYNELKCFSLLQRSKEHITIAMSSRPNGLNDLHIEWGSEDGINHNKPRQKRTKNRKPKKSRYSTDIYHPSSNNNNNTIPEMTHPSTQNHPISKPPWDIPSRPHEFIYLRDLSFSHYVAKAVYENRLHKYMDHGRYRDSDTLKKRPRPRITNPYSYNSFKEQQHHQQQLVARSDKDTEHDGRARTILPHINKTQRTCLTSSMESMEDSNIKPRHGPTNQNDRGKKAYNKLKKRLKLPPIDP